jgi:hypothetical protein
MQRQHDKHDALHDAKATKKMQKLWKLMRILSKRMQIIKKKQNNQNSEKWCKSYKDAKIIKKLAKRGKNRHKSCE